MLTIEAIYKLSDSEENLLKSLVGKEIHAIYADGVNLTTQLADYTFTGPLNLTLFQSDRKYYIFKYSFHENEVGEEYYTTNLFTSERPVQVNTSPEGHIQVPHACLNFSGFIVESIAVYGLEYGFIIQNNKEPVFWKILKDNAGLAIRSVISTEHILIFKSTRGQKMAIYPFSALPWIVVSFQTDLIDNIENAIDNYPFKNYRLKQTIN